MSSNPDAAGARPDVKGMQQVHSAAEIDEVLRSPAFQKNGPGTQYNSHERSDFVVGGAMIRLDGDAHRNRRKLVSSLVGRPALRATESWLLPVLRRRLAEVPRGSDGWSRTDLVPFVRNIALQVAARLIGLDDMDPLSRIEALGSNADRIVGSLLAHMEFELDNPDAGVGDPWAAKEQFIAQRVSTAKAAKAEFVDAFYRPARDRREAMVEQYRNGVIALSDLPQDLITILILNEDELSRSNTWDADQPVRDCLHLLTASDHTTSMTACHAISELFRWIANHPEDAAKLRDRSFLRAAVQESLRLHHVAEAGPSVRWAAEDVTLSTGRRVAAGEPVALWFATGGVDPQYYGDDADAFDPYRSYRGDADRRRRPYAFAFGGGSHVCWGLPLAIGIGAGDEVQGDISLVLGELFAAKVEPDPDLPPIPKEHRFSAPDGSHGQLWVWGSYPVRFRVE